MSENIETQVATPVTVSVDLDALIKASGYIGGGYNDDTDEYEPGGGLVEMVANLLANKLKSTVRDQVAEAVQQQVRDQVRDIVAEVISGEVKVTNGFGEPTGKVTTLRERIVKEAQEALNRKVNSNGSYAGAYDRDATTLTMHIARTAAKEALNKELKEAAAAAVAEVKTGVRDLVSTEISAKITAAVTAGMR